MRLYNHTPVPAFRPVGRNKQKLLAISLRDKVFPRHTELLRQNIRNSLGPAIRQAQIVLVRTHGVGMAFDKEDFAGIGVRRVADCGGDKLKHDGLLGANLGRSELEVDGVDADAPHALAQADTRKHFVKRVGAIERLHRRRLKRSINVVLRSAAGVDDVLVARDFHMGGWQCNHEGAKSGKPYPGCDGSIFKQNKSPPIRQVADAAHRPAVQVDLDLDAAAVRAIDVRDHVAVRPALRLRISAV